MRTKIVCKTALAVSNRTTISRASYVCSHSLAENFLITSDYNYRQTSLCAWCTLRCTLQLAAVQALLDEMGAEKGCLAVNQEGQCIIGRQEAFYIYTPDGRGPCFVFEGELEERTGCLVSPGSCPASLPEKVALLARQFPGLLACYACKNRNALPAAEGSSPSAAGYAWSGMSGRSVHNPFFGGSHAPDSAGSPVPLSFGFPRPALHTHHPSAAEHPGWTHLTSREPMHSNPVYVGGRQHCTGPSLLVQTALHNTQQQRAAALGLHLITLKWRCLTVPAGRKSHLQRLRHYLVAVTVGAGATQALQIYDLTNKLIGSTLQLPQVGLHCHTDSAAGACRQCDMGLL